MGDSSISTSGLQEIIERLKGESHRSSTRKNYYSVWKTFNEFFINLDEKPSAWEDRITLFIGFLINQKKKSTTVKSYVSAIKAILREDGIEVSENRYLLNLLTKACRLVNDMVRIHLPIQLGLLNILLDGVYNYFQDLNQPYLAWLYLALFCSSYFGLLRVGEVTSGFHSVKAADVHIGENKDKVIFMLRTSKTHWMDSEPQLVKISGTVTAKTRKVTVSSRWCPFAVLDHYASLRPTCVSQTEPFFIFSDRQCIKPSHMRSVLKHILTIKGFNSNYYDTHSLCIGMACDLLQLGVSMGTIKKLGRWHSNAVYLYLKN